jgi:hypothetical protein
MPREKMLPVAVHVLRGDLSLLLACGDSERKRAGRMFAHCGIKGCLAGLPGLLGVKFSILGEDPAARGIITDGDLGASLMIFATEERAMGCFMGSPPLRTQRYEVQTGPSELLSNLSLKKISTGSLVSSPRKQKPQHPGNVWALFIASCTVRVAFSRLPPDEM